MDIVHINMPELRLEFPFLIKTSWDGRAKRTVRNRRPTDPLLVNAYRAHSNLSVTGLVYINDCKLVVRLVNVSELKLRVLFDNCFNVSSSTDHSVRIWTLSGRYIGTLGSPIDWEKLSSTQPPTEDFNFRIPPDIKRIASSTTLQVSDSSLTTTTGKLRKTIFFFEIQVLKGGNVVEPLKELIAIKKHMKAEQEKSEEEARQKKRSSDTIPDEDRQHGRGFAEPFKGTIPFDFAWTVPSIEKNEISGTLESYQPFIPPLSYNLDELISMPNEPEILKKWTSSNCLEKRLNYN